MKVAFTIATSNYLAQAKTISDSFLEYNSDYKFIIVLLDKVQNRFDPSIFQAAELLEVEMLNIEGFKQMVIRYNIFELSNALKPFIADYIYNNYTELEVVLYFDSDMMAFNSFTYIEECLKEYVICITPHILAPIPKSRLNPDERNFLSAGIFNAGFFALSAENEAKDFISWWKEKLRYLCFNKPSEGLFVDQLWLNYVPVFFQKVLILRHVGYNMAHYNLHERLITQSDGKYIVNKKYVLSLFHFTGFDINNIGVISKHQNRFTLNRK